MRCDVRSRAPLAMLSGLLVAAVVAGCGGSSTASGLSARLLTLANLPAGWSSVAISASAVKLADTPCLEHLASKPAGWSYRTAAFVEGKSIPNLGEVLATGPRADQAWARFGAALEHCRSATLQFGKAKAAATVRRLSFPRLGRLSSAYAWSFTLSGIRLGFDIVLFQTHSYDGYISYANLGAPLSATVAAFAKAAVAKAQNGATAAVPGSVSIASAPVRVAHTRLGAVGYRAIGSGPSLVLITGYGASVDSWAPQFVDALAQHHHVIALDNAGIGPSAKLPGKLTIDAMAEQTSALIDTLHLGPTSVLGWSMGTMIAQALAVLHPEQVQRLVLCAAYPGNATTIRPSRQELNSFESGVLQKVMAALFPGDQGAAEYTYLASISSYPPGPATSTALLGAQRHAIDAWWAGTDPAGSRTATIAVPTLVADGAEDRLDPIANSRTLTRLIHGAELRIYPDAGHAFLFQDQATLIPTIETFLH